MILSLILTVNIVFAEDGLDLNQTDIYVSNEGSDSLGNGSADNPYQTIDYSINKASNNSNIYLKSGTYNSTGYEIVNKSVSITGVGEVTLDARNGNVSQNIFKINKESSLVLNNIKFVNGYADLNGEMSPIKNEGNLYISNCFFNNFKSINGIILNKNSLTIDNVSCKNSEILWDVIFANLPSGAVFYIREQMENPSRGEFITNIGICLISNSRILASVYNNKFMNMTNSEVMNLVSNVRYGENIINEYINCSIIHSLRVSSTNLIVLNNTTVHLEDFYLNTSNVMIEDSSFFNNLEGQYYTFKAEFSNISIKSSYCSENLIFESCNVSITHSTILGLVQARGDSNVNVNYNWWGDNKGPRVQKFFGSTMISNYWIVMSLNKKNDTVFNVDFTKYTNGLDVWSLNNVRDINPRLVHFYIENGQFTINDVYFKNGFIETNLINNNISTMLYASVDNQLLRIPVGEGLTNYTWYISNDMGNDYFCDGSYENPYKTLKKVVSSAFNGNKIYILPGYYTQGWNSNIQISKNLTFIGLGNVTIARMNNRNIFLVDEMGTLTIDNVSFTTSTQDYYFNSLIVLEGELTITNSNFYNIKADGVIYSKNLDSNILLDNTSFKNIKGMVIYGDANDITVCNSLFTLGYTKYIHSQGDYDENFFISVGANVYIINSTFEKSQLGVVTIDPHIHYSGMRNVYIYNSHVIDNNWDETQWRGFGLVIGENKYHRNIYSVIENSSFINNVGHLLFCSVINNSVFINNTATLYKNPPMTNLNNLNTESLIQANLINNSYFYGNSFTLSKSYIYNLIEANNVYYSTFIKNSDAYGGALTNPSEVHYCIFINNTSEFGGNDIFTYSGNLNCSSNWWGSNQKPGSDRVYLFLGTLTIDDWVIMNLTQDKDMIIASLDNLLDNEGNIYKSNFILPSRNVLFTTEKGEITPENSYLRDNYASSRLIRNTTSDFDVFAKIDNQKISLRIYNNSTAIILKDTTFYGKDNPFQLSLINVNGHKITNQILDIVVKNQGEIVDSFTATTDNDANAYINVDYPVGEYSVIVNYYGNGYFEKSSNIATIKVLSIKTTLISYNYTYYGKNNKFYAILADTNGRYLLNQNLSLKIYDCDGVFVNSLDVVTGTLGKANVLISLDTGTYLLKWDFVGDEWYEGSSSRSLIDIRPINTTIELPNLTLYGKGNDYKFTFKDSSGNSISDETILLKISNANESNEFRVKTERGVGSININLLPGTYNLEAIYDGDDVYGSSYANSVLNVEPTRSILDYNSHVSIPENGVFTVILKDVYGHRISGEYINLELYQDDLFKIYTVKTDGNGEANFRIDAPENNYFALINFNGSTWYQEISGASSITISSDIILNSVYINASDFVAYYGENKYFNIKFNDSNSYSLDGKIVSVVISSGDWSKSYDLESDSFGNVRLQITLDPGFYNITYKYQNLNYNLFASGKNTIDIYKMPSSIIASDLIVKTGESKNFEVKLIDKNGVAIPNLPVTINIDNKCYNVSTNSRGIAKLLINLDVGYHSAIYSFDNVNYLPCSGNSTILVVDDSKILSKIVSEDIISYEDDSFMYSILLLDELNNPIKSSKVDINVTDDEGNLICTDNAFTNESGVVIFNLNLTYGTYLVKTSYNGNELYFASYSTNNFYMKPIGNVSETILFGEDCEIINGYSDNYFVILKTIGGDFISNAKIEFIIKGNSYYSTTDSLGRAYLNVPFSPGYYEVKAKFNGQYNLTKASVTNHINVSGELIILYSQNIIKSFNNGTHYYVALYDASNKPLMGKTVKFSINNVTYEDITDELGLACFEVWLNPGQYVISASYQGAYLDEYASVCNNITVLTTVSGSDIVKFYDGDTKIVAKFINFIDKSLSNTDVIFSIDNVNYKVKTNKNGVASLNINLNSGNHVLKLINTLTGQIEVHNIKISSTLSTNDLTKYYGGSGKFKAIFKDKKGKPLKNANVKFVLNGKVYKSKTNSKGVASLSINLKPGKYTISTINPKTKEKHANKVIIKSTIISKNKKMKRGKKTNFKVKILNNKGKIAKNVMIKFKINKKTYKVKTNKKGIGKLNVKLGKGKYTVVTTYKDLSVKNKITVK